VGGGVRGGGVKLQPWEGEVDVGGSFLVCCCCLMERNRSGEEQQIDTEAWVILVGCAVFDSVRRWCCSRGEGEEEEEGEGEPNFINAAKGAGFLLLRIL